jgi:hypothetical protein
MICINFTGYYRQLKSDESKQLIGILYYLMAHYPWS